MARLLPSEDVPRAADLEVLGGDPEARAEVGELLDGAQAPAGVVGEGHAGRDEEPAGGGLVAPSDPPAQLVELREAVEIGPVDDHRVRGRDVEAVLDDRRGQEEVGRARREGAHRPLQLPLRHLAVPDDDAALRDELGEPLAPDAEPLDPVVDEVDLPSAVELGADRLLHDLVPLRHDVSRDGEAVLRGRLDDGEVSDPAEGQVQGAGDRRRRHGEDLHRGAQLLQLLLLRDAEALLLVDDDEAEVLEGDVLREDPVRPDDDVERPLGEAAGDLLLLFRVPEAGEEVDRHRKGREAAAERPVVLVGEDRRRGEDGRLLAVEDALEDGAHRDLGLAVADVAAEEAVHRLLRLHVALDVADRAELVGRLRELESLLELLLPRRILGEGVPRRRRAARVELQELLGDVLDGLADRCLPLRPARSAELVEGRGRAVAAALVLLEQVEPLDRDEEPGVARVAQVDHLPRDAAVLDRHEAAEEADAVLAVDDEVPRLQVAQVGEEGFGGGLSARGGGAGLAKDVRGREDEQPPRTEEETRRRAAVDEAAGSGRERRGRVSVRSGEGDLVLGEDPCEVLALSFRGGRQDDGEAVAPRALDLARDVGEAVLE